MPIANAFLTKGIFSTSELEIRILILLLTGLIYLVHVAVSYVVGRSKKTEQEPIIQITSLSQTSITLMTIFYSLQQGK